MFWFTVEIFTMEVDQLINLLQERIHGYKNVMLIGQTFVKFCDISRTREANFYK